MELLKQLENSILQIRKIAVDSVKVKEQQLEEKVSAAVDKMHIFIHQNIIELISERKTTLRKNEIMFKSIQIACSTFFEEYDR